ncbi:MAG: hypothetical protein ACJ8F1_22575 [Polyangia bacterium]
MSSFAEARAAASGADPAWRVTCGAAVRAAAPSAWRTEALRLLLARALVDGDHAEIERLAAALPATVAREERLLALAKRDPLGALELAGEAALSAQAWRALMAAGAARLQQEADSVRRDLLAGALCAALAHLSPAVAFLEAVALARCFAETRTIDDFHLLALSAVPGLSEPARVDLELAVGAALAARGAAAEAARVNAQAARRAEVVRGDAP